MNRHEREIKKMTNGVGNDTMNKRVSYICHAYILRSFKVKGKSRPNNS